jgi:Cu/Ag efflux protein CusF
MTMDFQAPESATPPGLKAGDRVGFDFVATPDGTYRATRIERKDGGAS